VEDIPTHATPGKEYELTLVLEVAEGWQGKKIRIPRLLSKGHQPIERHGISKNSNSPGSAGGDGNRRCSAVELHRTLHTRKRRWWRPRGNRLGDRL
jgi:hypothetical protein